METDRITVRDLPGVTVAIPSHNDADSILMALSTATIQTVPAAEIIVINDGSDEANTSMLKDYCIEFGATYVEITNRGLPSARNTALMLCRTEAFLPLDADDWLDKHYIEKTLPGLARADVVFTGLQEHGSTRNGTYMPGFDRPWNEVDEKVLWQFNRFFYCSLFRTEILRRIGGYHPAMSGWPGVSGGFEDWDVWINLIRLNTRFTAVNEVLFHYNTSNPDSMLLKAMRNREELVREMRRHHKA